MLLAMWHGFMARKVRVTLTAVSIALGVALMAGTLAMLPLFHHTTFLGKIMALRSRR